MKAMKSVSSGQSSLDHLRAGWLAMCGVFASLLVSGGAAAAPIQWTVGSGGNGHWYTLSSSPSTWTAAESEALSMGGHLVTINGAQEQAFLVSTYLAGADANTKSYWIGINDQATEGLFVWASGEPVTYTNWNTGEPNNYFGNEDYGAINWHWSQTSTGAVGTWNDTPDNGINGALTGPLPMLGIIELTSSAVPEIDPAGMGSVLALVTGALSLLERRRLKAA